MLTAISISLLLIIVPASAWKIRKLKNLADYREKEVLKLSEALISPKEEIKKDVEKRKYPHPILKIKDLELKIGIQTTCVWCGF